MPLHESTFGYLSPSDKQREVMEKARIAAKGYAGVLDALLPPGDDKDHALRLLRTAAMWANIAITRFDDGAPRGDDFWEPEPEF